MRFYPKRICLAVSAVGLIFFLLAVTSPINYETTKKNRESLPWGESFHDSIPHIHAERQFGIIDDTNSKRNTSPIQSPLLQNADKTANLTQPSSRVWPNENERYDRIVEQLDDTRTKDFDGHMLKKILSYNGLNNHPTGNKFFVDNNCAVQKCVLTADRSALETADVVIFQGNVISSSKRKKNEKQVWVWSQLESPLHSRSLAAYNDAINWTASYRRDSTIVGPYEKFVHFKNYTKLPEKPMRNYAKGKTKKVAWFVSNCGANNGRLKYAEELGKHIEVDIFGPCGKKSCPRSRAKQCFEMLNRDYKFYLAFENSNCRDYITEKFYWNGLWNDVLPVALGAAPEDYEAVAPPHSYIHVDDFESPRHLAEFLHKIDKNDTLYNEFFRWKGTGEFINTKFLCRICRMVHEAETYRNWYANADAWWRGDGVCLTSKHKRNANDAWMSWKAIPQSVNDTFYSKSLTQVRHSTVT